MKESTNTDMAKLYRAKPYLPDSDKLDIMERFQDILDTGMFIQGKYVQQLEQRVADVCGTKYAVATNSGATALELGIRAAGLKGMKILVPTQTFVASVSAIVQTGNIPVITDVDWYTHCLSPEILTETLDDDIGGVMMVHLAGMMPAVDTHMIRRYCKSKGVVLIEDASHAMGAKTHGGIMAGAVGDVGCFSLFATKIVTSGEGGMITTNSKEIADKARLLRNHGCTRNDGATPGLDYGVTCHEAASNYRMPEVCAAIGISQMDRLDEFITKRNEIAERYYNNLVDIKEIVLPNISALEQYVMTWWQYNITFSNDTDDREEIAKRLLEEHQVPTANAYWPPCHVQPAFAEWIREGDTYPNADDLLTRHLSLPMYVEMTMEQVDYVCDSLKAVLGK